MKKSQLYLAMIAGLLPVSLAFSADRTWNNSDGGDFGDSSNWTGGIPGTADRILVGADGTYTIDLDQDRTVVGLTINSSEGAQDLTLDLGGYTLTATGAGTTDFIVSSGADISRALRIVNGQLEGGQLRVDSALVAESPGHIIVGQDGVLISGLQGTDSRIGNGGLGLLEVVDNGRFESRHTLHLGTLDNYPGAQGTLIVNGNEARFAGVNVNVGGSQEGHMHVINGARADISGDLSLASSAGRPGGSEGFLEVHSGGHLQVEGVAGLRVGNTTGGNSNAPGETFTRIGHATITSGGVIDTTRLRVYDGSTLIIDGGSIVAGGSSVLSAGALYQVFLNTVEDTPLQVNSVTISNAILDVQLGDGFVAEVGGIYTLIDYDQTLTGLFVDSEGQALVSGDEIAIGDYVFRLDYGSGSGDVIGLELIPEPGAFVLVAGLLVVGGTLLLRRKKPRL